MTPEQRAELQIEGSGGVLVAKLDDGPLQEAGVKANDIILKLNHMSVKDSAHFAEIAKNLPSDKNVAMYLLRDGAPQFLPLKIAAKQ